MSIITSCPFSYKDLCTFLFFLLSLSNVLPVSASTAGTLIVSYSTGKEGYRLSRVRFWLINENEQRRIFPRGDAYVEDAEMKKRTVLVENLPPGRYTLEFSLPNRDHFFFEIPKKTFILEPGGVFKIDQELRTRGKVFKEDIASIESKPLLHQILPPYPSYPDSGYYTFPFDDRYEEAYLNIRTNIPEARWNLMRDGRIIYSGIGNLNDLRLPPGPGYSLQPEELENYEVNVYPSIITTLRSGQTSSIEVRYKRTFSFIKIEGNLPSGETLHITIDGEQLTQSISGQVVSRGGKTQWQSPPLPLGNYVVSFKLPPFFQSVEPMHVRVKKGRVPVLIPNFSGAHKILVSTNTSSAEFVLRNEDTKKMWSAKGDTHSFEGLFPGNYVLTFSSKDPERFLPPVDKKITLSRYRTQEEAIHVEYAFASKMKVISNIPRYTVRIEPIHSSYGTRQETITNYSKTILLPEGRYRVTFQPSDRERIKERPEPVEISLDAFETEEVLGEFKDPPSQLIEDETPEETKPELLSTIPSLASVQSGPMILGDLFQDNSINTLPPREVFISSFQIGLYEITNSQFATWLNEAYASRKIQVKDKGLVLDLQGKLLFKTYEAVSTSQILYSHKDEISPFLVLPSKENHPVIHVTWYGANFYSQDNGFRLPTEAEWEMAAGQKLGKDKALVGKKFRFGFSKDEVSSRVANYLSDQQSQESVIRVGTTPVGFYNGKNMLPLRNFDTVQQKTENAVSPWGAYDMSGNVWEWTADWFSNLPTENKAKNPQGPSTGTTKVAKGGCWASFAEGIRVAERIGLSPDWNDSYTGFRVAK
jgi:formylglycine-generating enzyme required for sulfatase activity